MNASSATDDHLARLLRSATATMHRRVERSPFMASLLRGQLDRLRYAGLLHNLLAIYAALEDALTRHASTPGVAPVVLPELFRSQAIRADLRALDSDVAEASTPLARATRLYVERLAELSATKPALLVAHAYVRYLGDLNGGQALRRVVARSLGLQGKEGTRFYDFGDTAALQRVTQRFRAGLAAVDAQVRDPGALADEAVAAFKRHEQLFAELAAA
jgi:heme oxygenase